MIPSLLQDYLVEDMKNLFDGFLLKNVENKQVPINIYSQYLPAKKSQNDTNHFPYIVIKLLDGDGKDEESNDTCRISFIIGIYDDDTNYKGYKDLINVIEKIRQHLFSIRIFDNKYSIEYPYNWIIHDDDTYPYFFGAIETHWTVPKVNYIDKEE